MDTETSELVDPPRPLTSADIPAIVAAVARAMDPPGESSSTPDAGTSTTKP